MRRRIAWIGTLALVVNWSTARAQVFMGPGGIGPVYGSIAPPVSVPVSGWVTNGPASDFIPNGFVFQGYGGIGPFGGPAYGRVLAGSNVLGYSNSGYSSFSGQYGGLGVPVLGNRVGGYSANASGFSIGSGGVSVYGAQDSFGYSQPGLVPGINGGISSAPRGSGLYPFGAYGSVRSGTATFLPMGGY